MSRVQTEKIYCDICGKEMDFKEYNKKDIYYIKFHNGSDIRDICNCCRERLNIILNWDEYKNKNIFISFNNQIETNLCKDAIESWNQAYDFCPQAQINQGDNTKIKTSFHDFLKSCADGFKKW